MGNQKPLETTGSHGSGDGGGVVDLDFMYFEYSIQSYGGKNCGPLVIVVGKRQSHKTPLS